MTNLGFTVYPAKDETIIHSPAHFANMLEYNSCKIQLKKRGRLRPRKVLNTICCASGSSNLYRSKGWS